MNEAFDPGHYPIDEQFDEPFANRLARLESFNKHLYRPNNYLHKWWARRCGTTFRLIGKHLVDDPDVRDYYTPGGLTGKVILDPMIGGGTILHEAIRLNANVVGYDIDPIPVLQAKATLSETTIESLREGFMLFLETLSAEVSALYRARCWRCEIEMPFRFILYGLVRRCGCSKGIFLDSKILRQESDGRSISICGHCHWIGRSMNSHRCQDAEGKTPVYVKGEDYCPSCRQPFVEDLAVPYYQRYSPVAVAASCQEHGFGYYPVANGDLDLIEAANSDRSSLELNPALAVEPGPKSEALIARNINRYEDLFSSRQLRYLRTALKAIPPDPRSGLFLGLLVSTSLDFNSMLCGYKGSGKRRSGAVRHVFSHHAYSFPYTALENNPIFPAGGSGTLVQLFKDRIERGRAWARLPRERIFGRKTRFAAVKEEVDGGQEIESPNELNSGARKYLIRQGSADVLDLPTGSVDFVITDPPYYDSVQYHDLAAFFRVWLEKLVPESIGENLTWQYGESEVVVAKVVRDKEQVSSDRYIDKLTAIFLECSRVLKPDSGRLIFTFHHWRPTAWYSLTLSLRRSGFRLINYYVVHSENLPSLHVSNRRALIHDVILVLTADPSKEPGHWKLPIAPAVDDSESYCRRCGQILAYLVDSQLDEQEMLSVWEQMLELPNN